MFVKYILDTSQKMNSSRTKPGFQRVVDCWEGITRRVFGAKIEGQNCMMRLHQSWTAQPSTLVGYDEIMTREPENSNSTVEMA